MTCWQCLQCCEQLIMQHYEVEPCPARLSKGLFLNPAALCIHVVVGGLFIGICFKLCSSDSYCVDTHNNHQLSNLSLAPPHLAKIVLVTTAHKGFISSLTQCVIITSSHTEMHSRFTPETNRIQTKPEGFNFARTSSFLHPQCVCLWRGTMASL